jgi:hypothetical protein
MNREYFETRTKAVPGDRGYTDDLYEGMWQDEVLDIIGVSNMAIRIIFYDANSL